MTSGKGEIIDQFHICDAPLSVVSLCRNLGIIVSNDLSRRAHRPTNDIVSKAYQRASLILRCFVPQNTSLLVRAFVTYVCPLL